MLLHPTRRLGPSHLWRSPSSWKRAKTARPTTVTEIQGKRPRLGQQKPPPGRWCHGRAQAPPPQRPWRIASRDGKGGGERKGGREGEREREKHRQRERETRTNFVEPAAPRHGCDRTRRCCAVRRWRHDDPGGGGGMASRVVSSPPPPVAPPEPKGPGSKSRPSAAGRNVSCWRASFEAYDPLAELAPAPRGAAATSEAVWYQIQENNGLEARPVGLCNQRRL